MSADLAVDRLTATLHPRDDRRGEDLALVDRVLRRVAGTSLHAALGDVGLPPGIWFVPRIDLTVALDLDAAELTLAGRWTRALTVALADGIRRHGALRYADDVALLADAVSGVATGRTERLWAWRQADVVRPDDPPAGTAPGDLLVAMLRRQPHHAVAALTTAVADCGVVRVDRVLGRRWLQLAAIVPGGAEASRTAARGAYGPGAPDDRPDPTRGDHAAAAPAQAPGAVWAATGTGDQTAARTGARPGADPDPDLALRALARALVTASTLATALLRARVRPDAAVAVAWAVLVAAEADPSSLGRAGGGPLVGHIARMLAGDPVPARTPSPYPQASPSACPRPDPPQPPEEWQGPPAAVAGRLHRGTAPPASMEGPALPPSAAHPGGSRRAPSATAARDHSPDRPESGVHTAWAGLPFLLATAPQAGLPDRVLDHPAFAARPLRWVVHRAGAHLVPVATDDAGLLALAGVDVDHARSLVHAAPPAPEEQQAVEELARDWAAVTAARYLSTITGAGPAASSREPREVVAGLVARRGWVAGRRGWIDVRFPLAEVDVDVRRAGLDLDPGWVPWLGTVVRFSYG